MKCFELMASACGGNLLDAQAGIETNINRECYPSPNAAIYSMLKRALKRYDCSLGKCAVCGNLLDAQAGIETPWV